MHLATVFFASFNRLQTHVLPSLPCDNGIPAPDVGWHFFLVLPFLSHLSLGYQNTVALSSDRNCLNLSSCQHGTTNFPTVLSLPAQGPIHMQHCTLAHNNVRNHLFALFSAYSTNAGSR